MNSHTADGWVVV